MKAKTETICRKALKKLKDELAILNEDINDYTFGMNLCKDINLINSMSKQFSKNCLRRIEVENEITDLNVVLENIFQKEAEVLQAKKNLKRIFKEFSMTFKDENK